MARNMQIDGEVTSTGSKQGLGVLGNQAAMPPDSYVKLHLAPQEWFPGAVTYETTVLKKADPATFQETFS